MSVVKKKLLVIYGAGTSMPCGMPGVAAIDNKMKEWCSEWKVANPFLPSGTGDGVFNDLWEIMETYYSKNLRPHLGIHPNFERVLGEMTALASWVTPSPFGNILSDAVRDSRLSRRFTWKTPPPGEPFFYQTTILDQLTFLLGKLADYMRLLSKQRHDTPEFQAYTKIIDQLRDKFELGIYNLNYDDLAVSAWPDAFTGFHNGKFDARTVGRRREWEFIYHLHGSVHYSFSDEPPFSRALVWKDDLEAAFKNAQQIPTTGQNFVRIIPTSLIAGGFKLDQLMADPFQTLYAALIRHAHEADVIFVAGYGFGDVHVNRALENRYALAPYDASRRPPAVVVTKSDSASKPTAERQEYDLWGYELTHALNTRFDLSSTVSMDRILKEKRFEKDVYGVVDIWHSGFIEVLPSLGEVIGRLSR